jgi:hypothetical protein
MALTFSFENQPGISIGDYLDHVERNLDSRDSASIAESAVLLYRLAQDATLLNDLIVEPIKRETSEIQPENRYTDATFMLGKTSNGRFHVRANVWKVPQSHAGSETYESDLYAYNLPHDHNFDFLTVGFYGPGYWTDLYEYEYDKLSLQIGEHADIAFVERTSLPVGKVMMYRKGRDIHTQLPPDDLSISINLLAITDEQLVRQQYFFDVENRRTAGFVDGLVSHRVDFINLVGRLGILDAVEPLMALARSHPDPRTRSAALSSALALAPGERGTLERLCGSDRHPLVRDALARPA